MRQDNMIMNEFYFLKVISTTAVGAFLEWQEAKDIFLPFSEQTDELFSGDSVLVYTYLDKSERPCASMHVEKFLEKTSDDFEVQQSVELWIYRKTELGYKAIVDNKTMGILYANEVYQKLSYGQKLKGYIAKIREDKKIDLTLSRSGHDSAVDIAPMILKMLFEQNGFLPFNEKTSPEIIYKTFFVSKKKYKMVLGSLYKKKQITIHEDGIRLVTPT